MKGALSDLKRVKVENPHIKTILSIGGGGKGSENFSAVANDSKASDIFAQHARQLVDTYVMDGVDSKCWRITSCCLIALLRE